MATLCEPFESEAAAQDPGNVKVEFDASGRAVEFTRTYVPRPGRRPAWGYRHIGLYGYRAGFLRRFTRIGQSQSERRERLEQLRALDNGDAICVEIACRPAGHGIDTPADLEHAATWALSVRPTSRGK
jgi:3-deoxy-manno-octulosonate cytidylyltransferase (CMP-KDO synthetase)